MDHLQEANRCAVNATSCNTTDDAMVCGTLAIAHALIALVETLRAEKQGLPSVKPPAMP